MSYSDNITQTLLQQTTSHKKKKIVDNDINGWLQTNKKPSSKPKARVLFRPAVRRQSIPTQPHTSPEDAPHSNVSSSRQALLLHNPKTKSRRTTCVDEDTKPSAESRQNTAGNEEEVKVKPFNTGYILKEMRRRKLQIKTLKRYQTPSSYLYPTQQPQPPILAREKSGRRMSQIQSARFIPTLREIQ